MSGSATPGFGAIRATIAALALFCAAPLCAAPTAWRVDPEASRIGFVYEIAGRAREGAFELVEGEALFDPEDPTTTRLELRIFAGGLRLDDPLETGFAQGPEWFDAANHPIARYRLARLAPDADGEGWTALGDLTIKERTVVLRTPLALEFDDESVRATGALEVNRRDFGLGLGLSDVVIDIADGVTVRVALVLRREE